MGAESLRKETVLVIDDDPALLRLISVNLGNEGYRVLTAEGGQEGLRLLRDAQPDLLVLDVNMPNMDGWVVCARVREISNIPILILTARTALDDVVHGLEIGADDYILKPFRMRELIARVRANLRRATLEPSPPAHEAIYHDSRLTINLGEHRVIVDGASVRLTPTEFKLLTQLLIAAPQVVTYRQLLEQVWGWEYVDDIDYLRVYVWHLRRKLERDPKQPIYIVNEHGVGYRFERQT